MTKVVLNLDSNNNVTDDTGMLIGMLTSPPVLHVEKTLAELTLQLIKQGVTPEEIIKLKNADLLV